MQSKRRWTDAVWDTINFDLIGNLFRRLNLSTQTFQMKFSLDQLPLGKLNLLQSSVNNPQLSMCPCCYTEAEDMHNFLQCEQNAAIPKGLRGFFRDDRLMQPHPLRRILHDGYISWQEDPTKLYNPDLSTCPPEFRTGIETAIKSQALIGWGNAFRGYLSKVWIDVAAQEWTTPRDSDTSMGRDRMRRTIHSLNALAKAIWFLRNESLHRSKGEGIQWVRIAEEAEIRAFFQSSTTLLHVDDRYLCDANVDQLLKSSSANRRQWLRRARLSKTLQESEENG
jgi:hypothetical protein